MPCCHFLLIVIVIAIRFIYKEFFKNMKMSKMLLRIAFNAMNAFNISYIFKGCSM